MKFTSLAWSGYAWPRCTAFEVTMNCMGMPRGFGFSSASHASVQSLRSMRQGFPVHERDRTVSRTVASR